MGNIEDSAQPVATESVWQRPGFAAYIGTTAFSGMALAMQQLLYSWLLIGVLLLPADQVGLLQALVGVPGILLMLMGGASADLRDPREMLIWIYLLAPVLPLSLILAQQSGWLGVASVTAWGVGMGIVQSYSMPGQQAILNRISGPAIQAGVTTATAIGFIVQVIGLMLAGQMDVIGIAPVLFFQAATLVLAGLVMFRIPAVPHSTPASAAANFGIARRMRRTSQDIVAGIAATRQHVVIWQVLWVNFVSSIFNAGSFLTVFPFIVKRVFMGDAWTLALLIAVFFAGAAVSNFILLRYMPLRIPGRLFLLMQLSRIVVLYLMWIEPDFWLMLVATIGWGLNMGVTTNLARAIVQESAPAEFRGRILSVFAVGMVGSAPIGAILLGYLVETIGTLNALMPAMLVSLGLFLYGYLRSAIWDYQSPVAQT